MLNTLAKLLLVSTSLAPVLGAVAVNQIARQQPWTRWGIWLAAALVLVGVCSGMLAYASGAGQKHLLQIREVERNDKEVLAFLLAYLLPFVSAENMAFTGDVLTGSYILGIILLVFAQAGAFHFNPLMGLLGYHFYSIKTGDGLSYLLITRTELSRTGQEMSTVRLAQGVYLQVGVSRAE